MYLDEYGNEWASYEDYKDYLNTLSEDKNDEVTEELLKQSFQGIYIDTNNSVWANKEKCQDIKNN